MELGQIASYLKENSINIRFLYDVTEERLKSELKAGNIVIVGMNMSYVSYNMVNEERVGKYFEGDYFHILYRLCKGLLLLT